MPTNVTKTYASPVTLVSSGAQITAGNMSGSADVANSLSSANHSNYERGDVTLNLSVSGSVNSLSNYVVLYRRDLNIEGTGDAPQPSTAYPAYSSACAGIMSIPPFTAASSNVSVISRDVKLSRECEFYIENRLNIAIPAGWTLKVTPKTDSWN